MSRPMIRPNSGTASAAAPRLLSTRILTLVAALAAVTSMGANYGSYSGPMASSGRSVRSKHFVVTAPTPEFARQVCAAAEQYRRELAVEWLGEELPPWQGLCPIRVIVGANLGAGGATSFTFINGRPGNWEMEIQGSRARILDSVLPHEITHTIMATHFGRPLPRWADEGAATSVEHSSERTKQDRLLIEFLTTRRGIAFNEMFAMKEYPRDILPLYSQGYSLARYLIAKGGKRKFVAYLGDGMQWNNWTAATKKHYGLQSLSELQLTWLDWVRQGSPEIRSDTPVASATPPASAMDSARSMTAPADNPTVNINGMVPLPPRSAPGNHVVRPLSRTATATSARPTSPSDGWYRRRRDEAARESERTSQTSPLPRQHVGRPTG